MRIEARVINGSITLVAVNSNGDVWPIENVKSGSINLRHNHANYWDASADFTFKSK